MHLVRFRILRVVLAGTAIILALGFPKDLHATPPFDPICGAPNSRLAVLAARAQSESEAASRNRPLRLAQPLTRPRLSVGIADDLQTPRLLLQGTPGLRHHLEIRSDFMTVDWQPFVSVILGEEPWAWTDPSGRSELSRFYRLRSDAAGAEEEGVSNFRLLDATGVARDLYYESHRMAVVVLSAGPDLIKTDAWLPRLKEMRQTYTNRLETWILLGDPAPVRTNVLAQAKALGVDFPILLDRHGLAARSVGITQVGEVAVIRPPTFTRAYLGTIDRPGSILPTDSYLGRALDQLNRGRPIELARTPAGGAPLPHVSEATPDYAADIAPLLRQYCVKCHYSGGVTPFAMTNHTVVSEWAPSIKHSVRSGQMPPWHADPDHGRFSNDLSLPGPLKSALIRWIDAGAQRGQGPDPLAELPAPKPFDTWPSELGPPDALVSVPLQSINAVNPEPYRYLFVQSPNPTNVWLKAAILRPSNYRAVHHYLVWLGRAGNTGTPDRSSYQSHIAEFVPGYEPFQFPTNAGMFLGRSNWLTFNLHYSPYGVATNDQPVLALWYHRSPPPKKWVPVGPANVDFTIPPGVSDHPVQANWTVPGRMEIHRFNPHMHVRGKRVKYEVRYPNGTQETLLSIPDYDFNWQVGYALAEPKVIPAGSQIIITGAFDNSPQNRANPDPTAQVRWGDQSWMEMFIGYLDFTQ